MSQHKSIETLLSSLSVLSNKPVDFKQQAPGYGVLTMVYDK